MKKEKEYKGIYAQDNENILYYEHGAHFSYKELYKRLEEIIKSNNIGSNSKDIANNKIIFGNLKKANSQKVIRYKNNKKIKINISRNSNANHNLLYNNLNNHLKIGKSKSINKLLNFSKSYNEEQFGPFSLNTKKNKYTKKAKELILKKNCNHENKTPMSNNIINKINKNNHTVLKYVMMSKKCTNKNEMNSDYYGISPNKKIDTDLNNYGEISFNPTFYISNSSKRKRIDLNKNKNYSNKDIQNNSKKYEKIKISSIINKRFVQKSISDSPKSSSSFLNNNSSNYSQSKTQRTSENIINYSTYTCKKQKNDSIKKFNSTNKLFNIKKSYKSLSKNILKESNNNYIDIYYIGNNNVNKIYNNINKNIFLSNNQKNKKLTIFNNFNKINYLNNCKNSFLLGEKEKNLKSNKNSIIKQYKLNQKINYNIQAKENTDIFFLNNNDNDNYNSYYYNDSNITPNIRKKSRKNLPKNHYSHNNILNLNTPDNNDIDKNSDNYDSMAFCIKHESKSTKNKKSRNKSKNIVNLLCCHFSININSPINLLNNIQNNISTNTNNNKTSKIIGKALGMAEENKKNEKKNSNCLKINNIKDVKFKNESQKLDGSKINKKESKELIKSKKNKIKKIPININKDKNSKMKINLKANKNNSNKDINNYFKNKNEASFNKTRFNSSKKIVTKKTSTNNINSSFNYNKKSNYNINNANNNNITDNSNNININRKVNVNNAINK